MTSSGVGAAELGLGHCSSSGSEKRLIGLSTACGGLWGSAGTQTGCVLLAGEHHVQSVVGYMAGVRSGGRDLCRSHGTVWTGQLGSTGGRKLCIFAGWQL